jgi:hypothetical protein
MLTIFEGCLGYGETDSNLRFVCAFALLHVSYLLLLWLQRQVEAEQRAEELISSQARSIAVP